MAPEQGRTPVSWRDFSAVRTRRLPGSPEQGRELLANAMKSGTWCTWQESNLQPPDPTTGQFSPFYRCFEPLQALSAITSEAECKQNASRSAWAEGRLRAPGDRDAMHAGGPVTSAYLARRGGGGRSATSPNSSFEHQPVADRSPAFGARFPCS